MIQYFTFSNKGLYLIADNSHQIRLDVEASVTLQVMSTEEPLLAKISGAPSILVTGTKIKFLLCWKVYWNSGCLTHNCEMNKSAHFLFSAHLTFIVASITGWNSPWNRKWKIYKPGWQSVPLIMTIAMYSKVACCHGWLPLLLGSPLNKILQLFFKSWNML